MRSRGTVQDISDLIEGEFPGGGTWSARDLTIDGQRCRFFYSKRELIDCEVGDLVEFDVTQKPGTKYMKYSNLSVVKTPEPGSLQESIAKVEAELEAEGKSKRVHPVTPIVDAVKAEMLSTNGTERKPLHALSLVELENEYQNAVRSGADGWYIGQISNIIKYEQIRLAIMELK